jgi:pimeloyl-ACP methyl ester carboxylesterase
MTSPAPAASSDVIVERGYTRCRYGQMHYREGLPASGDVGRYPVLVLLHQNPSSSDEYAKLIREMARDRRVIAFDTPGDGMSDPPPGPQGIARYAEAFSDALDAMNLGADRPVDLFGYHTGSLYCAELAIQRPDRVGRLAISGIPQRSEEERAQRLADVRATPGPTDDGATILARLTWLWKFIVAERDPRVPIERAAQIFVEKGKTLNNYWWPYEGVWSYDFDQFGKITQPVFILQPHEALLEQSRAAGKRIANCTFVELPTLDRDVFEVGVDEFAAELRKAFT